MEKQQVIDLILGDNYYGVQDLRYNRKLGFVMSKDKFFDFLNMKEALISEGFENIKTIPLKTFNSPHCFYVDGKYLERVREEYKQILLSDYNLNQSWLFVRNAEDMLISNLFSEVEGTLEIENVPTTNRRIAQIHKSDNLTETNDIIVKNMLNTMLFIIKESPEFNKENLHKVYNMLSKNCLDEETRLKDGFCYRDDAVYVGDFEGADHKIVEECMESLFAFANDPENLKKHRDLLPYICHYYILYIHPYFDYNGRTARMVSFWLTYINNLQFAPDFINEAINENKSLYYAAITNTRNTKNDLTYFLGYILETSIKYSFVYKNLEEIKKHLSKTGDDLPPSQWIYLKKILVHNPHDYFKTNNFLKYIRMDMTRQNASKILNNLSKYDILLKDKNKNGNIVYKLNPEMLTYEYN